jgi:hypothetical protein
MKGACRAFFEGDVVSAEKTAKASLAGLNPLLSCSATVSIDVREAVGDHPALAIAGRVAALKAKAAAARCVPIESRFIPMVFTTIDIGRPSWGWLQNTTHETRPMG